MTALPGQVGAYDPIDDENLTGDEAWAVKVADGVTKRITGRQVVAGTLNVIFPSGDTSGATDTAAFQAAAAAGGYWQLLPQQFGTYYAKARTRFDLDSSGLICPTGLAHILMLTGAGEFDLATQADAANLWTSNHVCFDFNGGAYPVLKNIRFTAEAQSSPRCCIPVAIRNCDFADVDIIAEDFAEAWAGLCAVSTCRLGRVRVVADGCTANTTSLGALQVSAVECDNYRIGGVNSKQMHFEVRYRDFTLGPAALAQYGPQTDGLSIFSLGWCGHTFDVAGSGVGEALDIWGDGCHGTLNAYATQLYALKVINGASGNFVIANVDGTGSSAVYTGNANQQAIQQNIILVNGRNVGGLWASMDLAWAGMPAAQSGLYSDNGGGLNDNKNNRYWGLMWGVTGPVMPTIAGIATTKGVNHIDLPGGNYGAVSGNIDPIEMGLPYGPVAISSGSVPYYSPSMQLDTEGAAASDDLNTIAMPTSGKGSLVTITNTSGARSVVVKDGAGNIQLPSDRTLSNPADTLVLRWAGAAWVEVAYSNNN